VFFDVGASYGLHSLKLLVHGVRVVSFEPNAACHDFFLESCRCNGVRPDIRGVAVGRAAGRAVLAVPGGRTYLGSTAPDVVERWGAGVPLAVEEVPAVTLDDVADADGLPPDVVKIDTEGSELAVLEGAEHVLERARPLVVLESWHASEPRVALFRLLNGRGYQLHTLRFGRPPSRALSLGQFLAAPATNFVARPMASPR
jgi:FkbM family methyltransferase